LAREGLGLLHAGAAVAELLFAFHTQSLVAFCHVALLLIFLATIMALKPLLKLARFFPGTSVELDKHPKGQFSILLCL